MTKNRYTRLNRRRRYKISKRESRPTILHCVRHKGRVVRPVKQRFRRRNSCSENVVIR
ncbi:hypothetical protein Hanom_Chr07g00599331 [Helianthus anomalus]